MPIIQQVHLRGTSTSGQFELTVVGFNFGSSPGDVLLLSGDADLDGPDDQALRGAARRGDDEEGLR